MATTENATPVQPTPAPVALPPVEARALDLIRQQGAVAIAQREETNKIFKALEGMEWGSGGSVVRGADMSPTMRALIAEFAYMTRANVFTHIDILGGKPYLNANYWMERMSSDPRHISHELINISEDTAKRKEYGVPAWATDVYEIVITKLVPFAPIEKIQSGEILEFERYKTVVRECNWAGGKPKATNKEKTKEWDADPVGNAEPAKTARTRTIRRGARVAYSAWMEQYEERIGKIERAIDANFEVLKSEPLPARKAALPGNGPQAMLSGGGEPEVAANAGASPLPVRGEAATPAAAPTRSLEFPADLDASVAPDSSTAGEKETSQTYELKPFAEREAQKEYFGAIDKLGLKGRRKEWQIAVGLPDSTTEFGQAGYARAAQLIDQWKELQQDEQWRDLYERATTGAEILGLPSVEHYCVDRQLRLPQNADEMQALYAVISKEVVAQDENAEGAEDQRSLV